MQTFHSVRRPEQGHSLNPSEKLRLRQDLTLLDQLELFITEVESELNRLSLAEPWSAMLARRCIGTGRRESIRKDALEGRQVRGVGIIWPGPMHDEVGDADLSVSPCSVAERLD